ncbi:hypothetical protein [Nocardioides hungaricus]
MLLDASCLIGVIMGEPAMEPLTSLLAAIDRGEIKLVESSAILAEVLPSHARDTGGDMRDAILELLEAA